MKIEKQETETLYKVHNKDYYIVLTVSHEGEDYCIEHGDEIAFDTKENTPDYLKFKAQAVIKVIEEIENEKLAKH